MPIYGRKNLIFYCFFAIIVKFEDFSLDYSPQKEYNEGDTYYISEEYTLGYYYRSRNSGCGCTGCLIILFIAVLIMAVILALLSTLLQIVASIVTMLVRLVILVLCIVVGLLVLIPSLASLVFIIRNIIFAIRDAVADNHLYRKPLAPPFKHFLSRFVGFTKDYWSYYLKHSTSTIKDCYTKCGNTTLHVLLRIWYFLLMIAVAFYAFVAPILLVILLILRFIFMRYVIRELVDRVTEFFHNLLPVSHSIDL